MVQKRKFDSNDGDAAIQHWRKENMASSRHVRGDIRPPLRSLDLNVAGGPHGTQERAQPSYIQYPNILEQHTTTVNGGLEGITANQNQEAIEADLEPPGTSSGNAIVLADEPDGPLYSGGVVTPAALFTAPTTLGVTPEVLNHATTVAEPPIDFASSGLLEAGAGTAESLLQTIANTEGANNAAATPGFPAYQPHFRTTQDALNFRKESRRIAPYIDPKNDATIELVVAEMPQWIALLYNSMVNRQGVRDSATSQGYKKLVLNKHYEPEEIEAACIDIMMEVLNLCQNGCELHHDLAILSEDRDDNKHDCFMRMIHICYALKFEKSICDEVLVAIVGDRVIKQFVNAPVAWRGRKEENRIGNWNKAEKLRQNKEAKEMGVPPNPVKKTPRVIPWRKTQGEPPVNDVAAEAAALGISIPRKYRDLLLQDGVTLPAHYLPHWDVEDAPNEEQQAEGQQSDMQAQGPDGNRDVASSPAPKKPKARKAKPRASRKKTNALSQNSVDAPVVPEQVVPAPQEFAPQEFAPQMVRVGHEGLQFDTSFGRPAYLQQDLVGPQVNESRPPVPSLRLNTQLHTTPLPSNPSPQHFGNLVLLDHASRTALNAEMETNDEQFDIALDDQILMEAIFASIRGTPLEPFDSGFSVESPSGSLGGLSDDGPGRDESFGTNLGDIFDMTL